MKKLRSGLLITSLLLGSGLIQAGMVAPTAHSRANCGGFNESVTWYFAHSYYWRVESHHFVSMGENRPAHIIDTGNNLTWRAAAYHATEAYSSRGDKWYVEGFHFYHPHGLPNEREALDTITYSIDCDIYDGWWDH